jgi:hypothetical protein
MATSKRPSSRRKSTVQDDSYNRLEMYCIWLNEYYVALKKAGFKDDMALGLMADKESYPDWVNFKIPTDNQISKYMDEDED